MVTHLLKLKALFSIRAHVQVMLLRDVTIDTIVGNTRSQMIRQTTRISRLVTLQAAIREQLQIPAFLNVRVVAIDTRHRFGFPEALRLTKTCDLIGRVNTELVLCFRVLELVMILQLPTRSVTERFAKSLNTGAGMTLCTDIE